MGKSKLKNDQIFKFFQIKSNSHSPFNEDPKNTFFSREALISGKGRPENLRKMDNNSDIYCFANPWVVNLERAYQPGTNIPVMPQFSYVPDQILGNIEKGPKFDNIASASIQKYDVIETPKLNIVNEKWNLSCVRK